MAPAFPFNLNVDQYSRQLWNKATYLYLAEFFRTAQFDSETPVVDGHSVNDYRYAGADDGWRLPGAGGGATDTGDYAFKITASQALDGEGQPFDPPKFNVKVLSGPAQVLGGAEKVFATTEFEEVSDGEYFYLKYYMWEVDGAAVNACDDEILSAQELPHVSTMPKSLVFALGQVGGDYSRYVNQFRLGAIQALVYINASPEADGLETVEL